ncbi:hypothetical protein CDS [Bradyrhizobium sp. G22]|nr:hypothetical protein CDS [Bradyrhizobium sp. G22]
MNCPTILIARIIMPAWRVRAPTGALDTADPVHSASDSTAG